MSLVTTKIMKKTKTFKLFMLPNCSPPLEAPSTDQTPFYEETFFGGNSGFSHPLSRSTPISYTMHRKFL